MLKKKTLVFVVFALALHLLFGCQPSTKTDGSTEKSGTNSTITAYFNNPLAGLPDMRDLKAQANGLDERLIELIDSASDKMDIAIHSLNDKGLLDALWRASKRGVKIRIITEDGYSSINREAYRRLKSCSNITVKTDGPDYRMHNKFMIVDETFVWTGSLNWTRSGIYFNANNAVLIRSDQVAKAYQSEFEQMFEKGRFGPQKEDNNKEDFVINGIPVKVIFSPSDLPEHILLEKIQNATASIYIAMFYYTNDLIHKALVDATNRGVKVKAVWDFRGWEDFGTSEMDEMLLRKIGVVDANPGLVHHKYAILDGKTIITGSANWSNSGMNYNDENILIIEDPELAQNYINDFNRLYNDAKKYDVNPHLSPRVTVNHHNYQDVLSRIEWRPHLGKQVEIYEICRAKESQGPCEKTFSNIPGNHRYFVDHTAEIGKTYYYRMRGFVNGEFTPFSNEYLVQASPLDCPKSHALKECSCRDGSDNDNDGYIDCQDFDCSTATACLGPQWRAQKNKKAVAGFISAQTTEEDFKKYQERLVTIRYRVVGMYDSGKVIFLNSSSDYKTDFTAVIFKSDKERFAKVGIDPVKQYKNRTLEVTGILKNYNGPEIVLRSPSQVRIVEND